MKIYNSLVTNGSQMNLKTPWTVLLFFLISLSFIMIKAYYPNGTILTGDDSCFHLNRFLAVSEAIKYGNYPFYLDSRMFNHYGYATNLFYSDFWLLPFSLLIKPLGFVAAYKFMLFTASILCGLITYFSLNKVLKNDLASIFTTILYTFSMYHLIDLGERGALGEYLAFIFVPLIFWGGYEIVLGEYQKKWYIIGIGFTCLILTHLISSFLSFILLCVFLLICAKRLIKEPQRICYLLLAGLLSVLLSSFFLLPMFEQILNNSFVYQTSPYATVLAYKAIHFRDLVFGLYERSSKFPLSLNVSLLIFPLFVRFFLRRDNPTVKFADKMTLIGLILLIMCTTLFYPWRYFPFTKLIIIQFPWRLLLFATFLLTCSLGIYLSALAKTRFRSISLLSLVYLLLVSVVITQGSFLHWRNKIADTDYKSLIANDVGQGEYLPSALPSVNYIMKRGDLIETDDSRSSTSNFERGYNRIEFDLKTGGTNAILPLLYYKGYKAQIDGRSVAICQSKTGLVELRTPTSGHVLVWYAGTLIQRIGIYLSSLTLIGFLLFILSKIKIRGDKN